jgi:hypothetical protein
MTKLEVFDPPMCCPTGVCGPNVDPALVKFAADLHWLANQRVVVDRFNLAQQPQAYVANPTVKSALPEFGNGCLPLILVDGVIKSKGSRPSRRELAAMAGVEYQEPETLPVMPTSCCGR